MQSLNGNATGWRTLLSLDPTAVSVTFGSSDFDFIYQGILNDHIFGRAGDDVLADDGGRNWLFGQAGNDILVVGLGDAPDSLGRNWLFGQAGDDRILGGPGNDLLNGGSGNDEIYGRGGNDRIFGMGGNDYLVDGAGDDFISGGTGNDMISLGSGNNIVDGGPGLDVLGDLDFRNSTTGVYLPFGSKPMTFETESGTQTVRGVESAGFVYGSQFDDVSTPGNWPAGGVGIFGLGGNDVLSGTGIWGGEGNDTITGVGARNDLYGEEGDDTIFNSANSSSTILSGGPGNDRLVGSTGFELISGDEGNDTLIGGAGTAFMWGGTGQDLFDTSRGKGLVFLVDLPFAGEVDRITGFGADDFIVFDDAVFASLPPGTPEADGFALDGVAHDAEDRIVYDPLTGALSFDADGNGSAAGVIFALLAGAPQLTLGDFLLF